MYKILQNAKQSEIFDNSLFVNFDDTQIKSKLDRHIDNVFG